MSIRRVGANGDVARAVFDDPDGLGWILDRLQARLERGEAVSGRLRLADPTDAQREALERLVGRRPTASRTISIEVADLARIVAHAGIADDLRSLVIALRGPIVDREAEAAAERRAWADLLAELRAEVEPFDRALARWVDDLERRGLLRRLGRDPAGARALLGDVLRVLRRLPADAVPLSQLAATTLGDSHALDDGRPAATLTLGAVEAISGLPRRDRSAAERRALWARVGVLLDELSAPVLVLGLRPSGSGLLERTVRDHATDGEPCRLTLRQLVRARVDWSSLETTVRLCENPSVVAAAVAQLGAACPALVCTDGQPSGAVQTLLRQLVDDGVPVSFHADFDRGGVRIGNLLVDRFGARPWRMGAADYLDAIAEGGARRLEPPPEAASWDRQLSEAMAAHRVAVHEEALLDPLLADLRRG